MSNNLLLMIAITEQGMPHTLRKSMILLTLDI